jgi:hypothetical protein
MKYIPAILAILGMQFLTGCFQSAIGLHVKPDGSGTVDQVFSMSAEALAQAKQMQGGGGDVAQKLPTEIDEAKLKAAAAKLGEGVTFVSAKKLTLPGREGFVATYAFTDVTKLNLTLGPDMGDKAGGGAPGGEKEEPVTFAFTKGSPSELVINTPVKKKPEDKKEQDDAMMAQMFKDMRVSFVVDVQGTIVKTNAVNREGNRITLMDVEFGKVLADPAKFKAMTKLGDPTTPEAKALLKTIPGVKIETENPVRISFQ